VPKELGKFIPIEQFVGLQVIDTKGTLVGNVKDVSLDIENKAVSLTVSTKSKGEMDFTWDDVQSVEDVVLLKKQVDLSSVSAPESKEASREQSVQSVQTLVICPNCGASSPARAKFCSKCGTELKA
jgi:sporulation protein YlmC with PRC-barrel domain/ribosomal protein L40E